MNKKHRTTIAVPVIDGEQWMGGAIYVRNLIYCLAALPKEQTPLVKLIGNVDFSSSYVRELAQFPFVVTPPAVKGIASRLQANLAARLPMSIGSILAPSYLGGIDLVFPSFGLPPIGAVPIHWIPDFQHIKLPQFFAEQERLSRDNNIKKIAYEHGTLVLSSNDAAKDFYEFLPDATIQVRVWRFCTVITSSEENGANPYKKYGLPERFIYLPNQFWAHKNHLGVFKALAILAARGFRPTIVCTGRENDSRDPSHMPMLRSFLAEHKLEKQVLFLGLVPRSDQISIFRSANFILQPSLFEGWSTVVEDAKALDRPLVLSDIPVHREQIEEGGNRGRVLFFNPEDPIDLADSLADAWILYPSAQSDQDIVLARTFAEEKRLRAADEIMHIFSQAIEKKKQS